MSPAKLVHRRVLLVLCLLNLDLFIQLECSVEHKTCALNEHSNYSFVGESRALFYSLNKVLIFVFIDKLTNGWTDRVITLHLVHKRMR